MRHKVAGYKLGRTTSHRRSLLRNMVTSPGGTSAEAIYQMEKGALRTVLSKAVWAAYQKSRLLGETVGKAEPRKPVDA